MVYTSVSNSTSLTPTGWARINRPLLIFLTNLIFSALSIAYPDVLFSADSEFAISFCPRANPEPVKDLSPRGISLLTHVHRVQGLLYHSLRKIQQTAAMSSSRASLARACRGISASDV